MSIETFIARTERATGADAETRGLLLEVLDHLFPFPGGNPDRQSWERIYHWIDCCAFESAVVALVEREYPEDTNPWTVRQMLGGSYTAEIELSEDCDGGVGDGKTPALALLLAFLRAKLSESPAFGVPSPPTT